MTQIDPNNTGVITPEQFDQVLSSVYQNVKEVERTELKAELDPNGSGSIPYNEFLS